MTRKILSLDPGTRFWGVTVFKGDEIVAAMVKVLSGGNSRRQRLKEARKIFLSLVEDYSPDVLAIESPLALRTKQLRFLDVIIKEIKCLARKERMKICEYSPFTVRKTICGDAGATKMDVAETVCRIYPELKIYLDRERQSKNLYWFHLFDSAAVGLCYLKKYINKDLI